MTQVRVWNFGDLLTQGRFKTAAAGLMAPGVYTGLDVVSASSTSIVLSAGSFMLPSGILVQEDSGITTIPPNPSLATDYTLVADHADIAAIGGGPVMYIWQTGLRAASGDPTATSVAILYLRHPGAVAVTPDLLSTPAKLRNREILQNIDVNTAWIQAPFSQACDIVVDPNIVFTAASHSSGAQWLGWRIANTAAVGLQNFKFRLPLPLYPKVRRVDIYVDLPALGKITLSTAPYTVRSQDGSVVSSAAYVPVTATVSTSPDINGPLLGLSSPVGTFRLGSYTSQPSSLGVTVTVPALNSVFIRAFLMLHD